MNIDSIHFKGHGCFKQEWGGFDTIKPINVIIGRNNSGKSHLLDLAETLCELDAATREWQYQCRGVLDEESLKDSFRGQMMGGGLHGDLWTNHGQYFVGKEVTWETTVSRNGEKRVSKVEFPADFDVAVPFTSDATARSGLVSSRTALVAQVLSQARHKLQGTLFRRLLADRDIKTEPAERQVSLEPDGQGATNVVRRFLLTSREDLQREVIQEELLDALNSVFQDDGRFTEIEVQVHDEKEAPERDHWEVYLGEDQKGLIPLSSSGSGLKTVLLVLLNLLVIPKIQRAEKSRFTFAFEELENNLHPALLRRFFRYLERFAVHERATILLTTHSSIALDIFGLSDSAQIVRIAHDGVSARSTTVPTHSGHLRVISELGARPSDLLQANGLVWVEGPSDRIYLNRWIELYSEGRFQEGRDYQCVFYGGALLGRVQFKSPEEETTELANFFRINHNLVVVCDGDREAEHSDLKSRVMRIREEVAKIDDAYIWITEAKEIENYLPGPTLAKAIDSQQLPDPQQYESWSSYVAEHIQQKNIDKVDLAIASSMHTTMEAMKGRFDWEREIGKIVERIEAWNEN